MRKPLVAFLVVIGLIALGTTFLSLNQLELRSTTAESRSSRTQNEQSQPDTDALEALGYLVSDSQDQKQMERGNLYQAFITDDQTSSALQKPHESISSQVNAPKLVWTGNLHIEADEPRAASDKLKDVVSGTGGYIASLNELSNGLNLQVTMSVRIPADKLDAALHDFGGLGKVLHRALSSRDVTLQYSDLSSRIRNLNASQERLLAHLGESVDIATTLEIEKELTRVLESQEVLQGQINALSDQIEYATLTVQLTSTPQAGAVIPFETFSTAKTATDAVRALSTFAQNFWVIAIWTGVWSPVWLSVISLGWFIFRRQRRTPVSSS